METVEIAKSDENQEKKRKETYGIIQTLDELGKEIEDLSEEKANLIEIERKLNDEIEKETKFREKKRDQMRTEVEDLKKKCEDLTGFVNKFRDERRSKK